MFRKKITGQKFGRFTVLGFAYRDKFKQSCWKCLCNCGSKKIISGSNLKSGHTKSCGCIMGIENMHKMSHTRFYTIWCCIKDRCFNKNSNIYKWYGGKGITVCGQWLKFPNFRDDMYKSYLEHVERHGEKQTSIDRIDNNGNYEPSNCKWATIKEQQNNKPSNTLLTYKKETLTISQWADKLNIPLSCLHSRFYRNWSVERLLTTSCKSLKKTRRGF